MKHRVQSLPDPANIVDSRTRDTETW